MENEERDEHYSFVDFYTVVNYIIVISFVLFIRFSLQYYLLSARITADFNTVRRENDDTKISNPVVNKFLLMIEQEMQALV